jgi:tRNA G26 N,N-dimethylase Trm1
MRLPEMENPMDTRDLVAMFMESPFYFDLQVRERLALVQQHYRRFSINSKAGQCRLADKVSLGLTVGTKADKTITFMVGFIPPKDSATGS